jgi:hypothetical protein
MRPSRSISVNIEMLEASSTRARGCDEVGLEPRERHLAPQDAHQHDAGRRDAERGGARMVQ